MNPLITIEFDDTPRLRRLLKRCLSKDRAIAGAAYADVTRTLKGPFLGVARSVSKTHRRP